MRSIFSIQRKVGIACNPWARAALASFAFAMASYGATHAQNLDSRRNENPAMAAIYDARFANLKLGMTLKQALDTLAEQGYTDVRGSGIAHIYRNYRYGLDCPKDQSAPICQVYGNHNFLMEMEFTKHDSGGNQYKIIVDFTKFYLEDGSSALYHARVKRINGFVIMKGPMDASDYEKLATEKYGPDHHVLFGELDHDWNGNGSCTCLYATGTSAQGETPAQLRVTIEDEEMPDDIDQTKMSADIERRKRAAQKPVF